MQWAVTWTPVHHVAALRRRDRIVATVDEDVRDVGRDGAPAVAAPDTLLRQVIHQTCIGGAIVIPEPCVPVSVQDKCRA